MKYADPSLCPGCRGALIPDTERCSHCGLLVRHALARQLFTTLASADSLVTRLRTEHPAPSDRGSTATDGASRLGGSVQGSAATGAPMRRVGEQSPTTPPPPPPHPAPPVPPQAPYQPQPRQEPTLTTSSIPKILLGLGALFLLVAAAIFLAVAWDTLGVAGRTAVLVGLTASAGGASWFLLRHEFRIAAEAFASICLGLLALDLTGAHASGWFGDLSDAGLVMIIGGVLVMVGTGFAMLTRPHLGAPQVATAIGALLAWGGDLPQFEHELITGHVALALIAALLWGSHALGLRVQTWGLLAAGGVVWAITALGGAIIALEDAALVDLWWETGAGWSLLASAAALLVPALILRRERLLVWSAAGSALIATYAVTVAVVDESAVLIETVALLATAAWTVVAALLPRRLHPIPLAPATIGALILASFVLGGIGYVAQRWAELGEPFSADAMVAFSGDGHHPEALLLAPAAIVVVVLAAIAMPTLATHRTWLRYGGLGVGAAAILTLACYDVPLVAVSAAGLALTIAATVLTLTAGTDAHRNAHGIVALGLAGLGALVALPSATLTTIVAVAALAVAAALHLAGGTDTLRILGGVALAPSAALALAAGMVAAEVDAAWIGVPTLLVVGILAIALPRLEVEVPAVVVGFVATVVSVPAAANEVSSLALHLAVAGGLCAATALIHDHRRVLVWPGLALLVLASWVRLADLDVTAPEPYTLPLAVALTGAGLWRMQRDPQAGTLFALLPGLALGTVPSLLWVIGDPVSVRALVLGAACVALTIAGAMLRWSAPLLVGAVVGAIVVLRELGPYAGSWPQWVWIGLAGTLLVIVGITWERRLLEVRKAVGMLGRLR